MKLRNWIIALCALLLMPTAVFAAEFKSQDNVNISSDQTVNDDLYIAGNNSTIDGTVNGDLFIAGGQLNLNGNIADGLYAAGGNITVAGNVGRSVKVAGGTVNIKGQIEKDLFVAGGTVNIEKGAVVKGGVYIGGGQVTIAGTTGPVKISSSSINLAGTAVVNGDITYWSDQDIDQDSGAKVTGVVTKKVVEKREFQQGFGVLGNILSLIYVAIVALILVLIFPKKSGEIVQSWKDKFGYNLLWGLLFAVVLPITAIILLITIIGVPFGIGLFLIYPIYLYLGKLAGVVALGSWLKSLYNKDTKLIATWSAVLLGVVAYGLISLIPAIGPLAKALIVLAGIGVLVDLSSRVFVKRKS